MADTSSGRSAAARVFDIPELLEHILVDLAVTPVPPHKTDRQNTFKDLRPLSDLCGVRRVNKMFNGVVATSIKLQRLLRKPLLQEEDAPKYMKLKLPGGLAMDLSVDVFVAGQMLYTVDITDFDLNAMSHATQGGGPEASWRQAKIYTEEGSPSLIVAAPPVAKKLDCKPFWEEFDTDTTLGKIVDYINAVRQGKTGARLVMT